MRLGILCLLMMAFSFSFGQSLDGAWMQEKDGNKSCVLIASPSFSVTEYNSGDGAFVQTYGGTFTTTETGIQMLVEFHSSDTSWIGSTIPVTIERPSNNQVNWRSESTSMKLNRMDDPGFDLAGPFLFSGRKANGTGELSRRDTQLPRKTMKILSGGRFQWIAYHVTEKRFLATGGGSYTLKDGQYTEHIEFFSRDNSRVGASLTFNYELQGDDWHHSGKSSKGDPMYEIWTLRTAE